MTDERRGLPSASSMGKIIACPASVGREAGLPEEPNEAAASGTRVHEALGGQTDHLALSDHESYLVRAATGVEEAIRESLGFAGFGVKVERERRLWLDPRNLYDVNYSGRFDKSYRIGTRALVVDYKAGRREVAGAAENWQMAAYAVLLWAEANLLGEALDEIHVAVIQPMASPDRTIARFTPPEIREAGREIVAALRAAREVDAPAYPGGHCYYCKARGQCPEALTFAKALVRTEEVEIVQVGRKTEVRLPPMTPEQVLHAYEMATTIERIVKAVREKFKESVSAGEQEGYEMGKGATTLEVRNPVTIFKRLHRHVPTRRLLALAKFSVDAMDEAVANAIGVSKNKARSFWVPLVSDGLDANEGAAQVRKKKDAN